MTTITATMSRADRISHTLSRTDFPIGMPAAEDGLIHRSGREGVVKRVHALCDRLIDGQGKARKDVIAKAEKLGIAYHTAATQYDRWRTAKAKVAAKRAANRKAKSKTAAPKKAAAK